MERQIINPWTWQDAFGFVQANEVRGAGRTLVCSGQTSVDANGAPLYAGDMAAQIRQAVANVETVLGKAGFRLSDVVRLNYYTTDIDGFMAAGAEGLGRLAESGCRPASTLLGVSRLFHPDLLVEIEATAMAQRVQKPVGDPLEALKAELERFGEGNDAATSERPRRMLNITRDTGEFLAVLVRATAARRVLEIGTSNGYSTLWLADAARGIGGSVTTVEFAEYKIGLAAANFARSGLSPFITLVHDDAGRLLQRSGESAYDLIFLDSERPEYPGWWPHLRRALRSGGLLIVDNATSHVEQMAPFVALVTADPEFATCLIPVGNGEFLAVKTSS